MAFVGCHPATVANEDNLIAGAGQRYVEAVRAIQKAHRPGFHERQQNQVCFMSLEAVGSAQRDMHAPLAEMKIPGIAGLLALILQALAKFLFLAPVEGQNGNLPWGVWILAGMRCRTRPFHEFPQPVRLRA